MCLDMNKMELVWVQDILDDSNCTPVLSVGMGVAGRLGASRWP